jgi:hypothetical protein
MAERLLVEALQHHIDLLLEELAVGGGVEKRGAERLHLARVVAAADAHDDAAVGDDVRHRVVLGEAHRMPHGQDVERAAELQPSGLGGEPRAQHDEVRQHLVALALEVMLRRPQAVVAQLVHRLGHVLGRREGFHEPLVAVPARLGGRAAEADVLELDLTDVQHGEFADHRAVHPPSITSVWPVT